MTESAIPQELLEAMWNLEAAGADLVELARDSLSADDDPDLRDDIADALERWHSCLEVVMSRVVSERESVDVAAGAGAAHRLLTAVALANEQIEHLRLLERSTRRRGRRVDAFLRWARGDGLVDFAARVGSLHDQRVALAAASIAPQVIATPDFGHRPKRRRRGRTPKYDPHDDSALVRAWERAKEAGVSREKFMVDSDGTVADLLRAQARERKRPASTKRTKCRQDKS